MKLKALLFLLLAAILPLAAPRPAQAADVSFDYFYDALLPYGEWIEIADYGFCWRPTEVEADWTPYADGYWAFTDAGWTWVGYEDFAGIVYHYGRWISVEGEGWCWVPDYEWGPAWVSWRKSDDYVGWAPLPPRAYWQPEIGISTWVDTVCDIGPAFYSFCRVRDFGAPVLRPVIINRARNVTIIRSTVNITNITYNSYGDVPVIYNGGLSFAFINRQSERPIPALKLVRHTRFDRPDFHSGPGRFSPNARTVGNQLIVNAPIVAPPAQPGFLKDKVKKVFAADKVRNGWSGVKDAKERTDLRQRFQRETKGLTPYTAPARAVVATDLKVVPAQADPQAVVPAFTGKGQRGKGDRPQAPVTATPVAPAPVATPPPPATRPAVSPEDVQPADPRIAAPNGVPADPTPAVVAPGEDRGKKPRQGAPVGGFHKPGEKPQPGTGDGRPVKPVEPSVVTDPAPAQAAAEAAKAAREQAATERQKIEAEKQQAAQTAAEKVRGEQERAIRQRDAEAGAAALRQKQAAETAAAAAAADKANAQEQQRAAQAEREKLQAQQERAAQQRDAEAARAQQQQAEKQRQQAAAQAQERLKQQQEQAAEQRRQQAGQQKAAQDAAKQQAAERAREQQAEQQRGAQEAARQQAIEQRKLQMEQQRAAQGAAKQQAQEQQRAQQAEQQRAAQEAARQQESERRRQQMEQQKAAQEAARQQSAPQQQAVPQQQPAQERRRGEKDKDKDKDKNGR
ncbi:MAG: hypothetical protein K8R23_13785 [Chthoniobacter sp.]|nr:hypothetical protein [Chthoniobacter sp.]